jgi:hypothetical protein
MERDLGIYMCRMYNTYPLSTLLALSEILHSAIHEWTDDRKIVSKLLELVFTFLIN